MQTPFPVSGYHGPGFFCDREKELEWLKNQITGNVPAVIIGIRRLGKTGLLHHLFYHLNKGQQQTVFVDLMGTRSISEMLSRIGEGIANSFPERQYEKVWKAIKSLRPTMTFDPYSGKPKVGFDFQSEHETTSTLGSLLSILEDQPDPVVLALDEFQEIEKYPGENTEGIIRAEMQRHKNVRFVFSGSQTHLLSQMFTDGVRPFFGGVQKLYLDKIKFPTYTSYIGGHFAKADKNIPMKLVEQGVEWTAAHTYYTQYVFNQLFLRAGRNVIKRDLLDVQYELMQTSRIDFFQLRDTLSPGHWKILVASAKEESLQNPTSGMIIKKYDLDTPRAIMKGIEVLMDRQFLFQGLTPSGKKSYQLTDVFLMRWIQENL